MNDLRNYNEIFRKDRPYVNIKVTKKKSFWKNHEGGSN